MENKNEMQNDCKHCMLGLFFCSKKQRNKQVVYTFDLNCGDANHKITACSMKVSRIFLKSFRKNLKLLMKNFKKLN